jgi:hypothetical protein
VDPYARGDLDATGLERMRRELRFWLRVALVHRERPGLAGRAISFVREMLGVGSREKREALVRMKSLAADGYHYIKNSDGYEELYDLRTDPDEERDLSESPESRDQLVHLRTSLERVLAPHPLPDERRDSARVATRGAPEAHRSPASDL